MKEILGPIQEADKQFIRGLVRMIRPKVVLEFGLFILHTLREMRHGMTVLQFYSPLEIPPR